MKVSFSQLQSPKLATYVHIATAQSHLDSMEWLDKLKFLYCQAHGKSVAFFIYLKLSDINNTLILVVLLSSYKIARFNNINLLNTLIMQYIGDCTIRGYQCRITKLFIYYLLNLRNRYI